MTWNNSRLTQNALKRDHLIAQGHRCFYCHHEISVSVQWLARELHKRAPFASIEDTKRAAGARLVTLEHLTPKSNGGYNHRDVTAVACQFCNNLRGNADMGIMQKFTRAMLTIGAHPHQLFLKTGSWFNLTRINPAFTAWIEQQQQGNDPCSKSLKPSAPVRQSPPPLSADRDQAKPTAP